MQGWQYHSHGYHLSSLTKCGTMCKNRIEKSARNKINIFWRINHVGLKKVIQIHQTMLYYMYMYMALTLRCPVIKNIIICGQ